MDSRDVSNQRIHIGLTGLMASGKGEVVKILQLKGFKYISLSDIVRKEAQKIDKNASRKTLQNVGNQLREKNGSGVLGKLVREEILSNSILKWAIDGIRNPAEIDELRKLTNFFLVGINSNMNLLIERMVKRQRSTDLAAAEELKSRLNREWGEGEPDGGQLVGRCLKMADYLIKNDGSLEDLRGKTNNILYQILEIKK